MEEEQLVGEFGHNDTNEQTIGAGHGRGRSKEKLKESERQASPNKLTEYAMPQLKFWASSATVCKNVFLMLRQSINHRKSGR